MNLFKRPRLLPVSWLLSLLLFASIAQSAPEERPSLRFNWQPTCAAPSDEEFLTVDVFTDGRVRYVGNDEMKEKGERSAAITQEQLARLIREVERFAAGRAPAPSEKGTSGAGAVPYCISLMRGNQLLMQVGEGSPSAVGQPLNREYEELQRLDRIADEALGIGRWACPSRSSGFVATRFCGEMLALLRFVERPHCAYMHTVMIYPDGKMSYFVDGLAGSDRYQTLTAEQLQMIKDLPQQLGKSDLNYTFAAPPAQAGVHARRWEYTTPENIARAKPRIAEITEIVWQKINAPPMPCYPTPGTLVLYLNSTQRY